MVQLIVTKLKGWLLGWIYGWALIIAIAAVDLGAAPYFLDVIGTTEETWKVVCVGAGVCLFHTCNTLIFYINFFSFKLFGRSSHRNCHQYRSLCRSRNDPCLRRCNPIRSWSSPTPFRPLLHSNLSWRPPSRDLPPRPPSPGTYPTSTLTPSY